MSKGGVFVELHVPDFKVALEFYRRLGFELLWSERDYMVLGLGDSLLHFYGGSAQVQEHSFFGRFPDSSPRGYGVEVILFVEDVSALYEELGDSPEVVSELQERPWGSSDFRIVDPFGYYLRVSEPYDSSTANDGSAAFWKKAHGFT